MQKLISQRAMAAKYGENPCTISIALNAAGVKPVSISDGQHPRLLYNEHDAVQALMLLFMDRAENHIRKAEGWKKASKRAKQIYQEGLKDEQGSAD